MVHAQGTYSSYRLALTELYETGEYHNHAATIQILPDLLPESQTISSRKPLYLVQLLSSPRYLDPSLCFSNEVPISYWLEFPIFMSYSHPIYVDDVSNQAPRPRALGVPMCFNELSARKVAHSNARATSELTHHELSVCHIVDASVQRSLSRAPVPFLASPDLVSLHLDAISMIDYISPEAMVAGLVMMTSLEMLRMRFPYWDSLDTGQPGKEPRSSNPGSPSRPQ